MALLVPLGSSCFGDKEALFGKPIEAGDSLSGALPAMLGKRGIRRRLSGNEYSAKKVGYSDVYFAVAAAEAVEHRN